MPTWAIIPAAGSGERLGSGDPKAFVRLAGTPLLRRVLLVLAECDLDGIVLAVPAGWEHSGRSLAPWGTRVVIVAGGSSRRESVRTALAVVPASADAVVVHDAARPFVTKALVDRAVAGLSDAAGAICAVPIADTVKRATDATVVETLSRGELWRAQTPQAFRPAVLRDAHARAEAEGWDAPDDAALVERTGAEVRLVPGDERNVKITTAEDLARAEAMMIGEEALARHAAEEALELAAEEEADRLAEEAERVAEEAERLAEEAERASRGGDEPTGQEDAEAR